MAIDEKMAQEAVGVPTRSATSKMVDITEDGNDVLGPSKSRTEDIADEG